MDRERREGIVKRIKDSAVRTTAEEHPECLHPCVWLVRDENGPLVAGGKPPLPVGREWPRVEGKLLAYLMAIDASMLPEWSPLPRDCGELLVFVGHTVCEMVVVGRGVETQEVDPPLEDYLSEEPEAGEVLETVRFRLEEGLHAGVPETWSAVGDGGAAIDCDDEEALRELNQALRPADSFGRLFGHHEFWVEADAGLITKYSYLDVNGYREGWYADLEGPVKRLEEELEAAKRQPAPAKEELPRIADDVVEACEAWVAEAAKKVEGRREVADSEARKKVERAREKLARRQERWIEAKGGNPVAANKALEELVSSALEIDRDMRAIPGPNDAQDSGPAKETIGGSGGKSVTSDLYELLTAMQYACQRNSPDAIRKTWRNFEDELNLMAPVLEARHLATALHWRLHGYQSLVGWLRSDYVDPQRVAGKIAAIRWWQGDVQKHEAALAHWSPLLVMDSDGGPYFWGDAGWAIVLADGREVRRCSLGRLAIALDVS